MPETGPALIVTPAAPTVPFAPETVTLPRAIVRPVWLLAPVSVRVLLPTFVSRKAPLTAPLRVMSLPAEPPLVALIQSDPTLAAALRASALLTVAAVVVLLLTKAPSVLRAVVKLPRPVPAMERNSAVVWPFRSSTEPLARVVPSVARAVAAPRAPAPPSLMIPPAVAVVAETEIGPRSLVLLSVFRKRVFVPVLVSVTPAAVLMVPSVRSP